MTEASGSYFWVDYISIGILLSAVAMNALRRLESCIRAYTINSVLLSALVLYMGAETGGGHLYLAALLTFLTKAVILPLFLGRIVRKIKMTHEVEPFLSNMLSLAISGVLIAVVYASLREGIAITGPSLRVLQISVAVIVISLFLMITRKKAVTMVIGLLFMENGVFLAGFSLTRGMPSIIELGILFDMLMGIIILGIFAVQIRKVFRSSDLDSLTVLKG